MLQTSSLDFSLLIDNSGAIPRESFNYFEYKFISTEALRKHFIKDIEKTSSNERNFLITVFDKQTLKGFLTCEYIAFDSEIFGFEVYRITNFALLGTGHKENEQTISIMLKDLERKIESFGIKYLTISLNQNVMYSQELFNSLMNNSFYYINTLLTFKMEKEDFSRLSLYKKKDDKITIRTASIHDRQALYSLAYGSYKINRFHLDNNLDNLKCNLLHSKSLENSLLKGYADIIYVAEIENQVVGYYSGKKRYEPELEITLGDAIISAVDEKARGMGVFSALNNHLLNWFHENTDLAEMGTYINNHPVYRVWTRNGLGIIRGSHQLARFRR
jgi:GNAT superfamily N-acetyltransferase